MTIKLVADVTLDTSGTLCPVPVIRARQALDKMLDGQVLKIIASDPGSQADIPSLARSGPYTLLEAMREGKKFVFFVNKGKKEA